MTMPSQWLVLGVGAFASSQKGPFTPKEYKTKPEFRSRPCRNPLGNFCAGIGRAIYGDPEAASSAGATQHLGADKVETRTPPKRGVCPCLLARMARRSGRERHHIFTPWGVVKQQHN